MIRNWNAKNVAKIDAYSLLAYNLLFLFHTLVFKDKKKEITWTITNCICQFQEDKFLHRLNFNADFASLSSFDADKWFHLKVDTNFGLEQIISCQVYFLRTCVLDFASSYCYNTYPFVIWFMVYLLLNF